MRESAGCPWGGGAPIALRPSQGPQTPSLNHLARMGRVWEPRFWEWRYRFVRDYHRTDDRQAWLGSVEGLDLGLLIDGQHDGMCRRAHIEADDVLDLLGESGVLGALEGSQPVRGCSRCVSQMRWIVRNERPTAAAIARPVQWVVSPGRSRF